MLDRLYRALLWLYPPAFRKKFGRHMREDFQEMRARNAGARVAFLDLLRTVPLEWLAALSQLLRPGGSRAAGVVDDLADLFQSSTRTLRSLARRPGYTLVVVASLGVGVGTATAVFSWTEGLVLRPLPAVDDLSALVTIDVGDDARSTGDRLASFPDVSDLREGLAGIVDVGAFGFGQFAVSAAGEADVRRSERVWGAFVTAQYFSLLGVEPLVGSLRQDSDGGPPAPERAFVSEAVWTRVLGRDPRVVGRTVRVAGRDFQVAGVVPGDFTGTTVGLQLDVWLPVDAAPTLRAAPDLLKDRSRRWLRVFGRLAAGSDRSAAGREVRALWTRLETAGLVDPSLGARVAPFDVGVAARLRPLLLILLGLTALLLLAVCSNVANLTLMRGAAHDHEVAVMRALGADRVQVARSVLTESLVLGLLGTGAGLAIAAFGVRLLPALLPPTPLPLNLRTPMDLRVFAFCATVGLASALVSGAAPARRSMRSDPVHALRSRGQDGRRSRIQHASLIVTQLALSLGTLVAAGFFLDRLGQLDTVDRGFVDPQDVILYTGELPLEDAGTAWETGSLDALLRSARGAPGVRAAAVASFVPLGFVGYSELEAVAPASEADDGSGPASYLVNRVGEGYFELMGTPILAGRPIDAGDAPGSPVAVVVNEAFARKHWPGGDPVGRSLALEGRPAAVVGVAADGKYRFDELDEAARPFMYVAFAQWPSTAVTLHVRVDPSVVVDVSALRRAFERSFPRARVTGPVSLAEYTSLPLVPVRLGAWVLGGLGALAMVLAALGLYAIMAYRVTQRTREVGIRIAVGARRGEIVGMFVRQGATTAAVGIAVGIPIAVGIHRAFATLIPGFRPGWVTVYSAAATTMFVVALAAVTLAAARATSIAPTEALSAD